MKSNLTIPTSQACEFVDITSRVEKLVTDSKIQDGLVVIFVPHTTAGVTINENADPDVKHDLLLQFDRIAPQSKDFRHGEGNSPAHIKSSLVGSSVNIIISGGRLNLGTWQGIYFCEFDGPRTRKLNIKIIEG